MTPNLWIEVTSGVRWNRMLKEGVVVLEAPKQTRYLNFFKDMKANDIVLHYLTNALTYKKEWRSSIVAISKTISEPIILDFKIQARCSEPIMLPKPISYSLMLKLRGQKSEKFKELLNIKMQRYLTKITLSDFYTILDAYPENRKLFEHEFQNFCL